MSNIITGTDGNDTIAGTIGHDVIFGGPGNDRIYASNGNDLIFGGDGDDLLAGEAGNDTIHGGDGNDVIYGGGGDDLLFGEDGDDGLVGDGGNDTLDGGRGNDVLHGGAGNDLLIHTVGFGHDTLQGNSGYDTVELRLTASDVTEAVRADLVTLKAFMADQLQQAGSVAALVAQWSGPSLTLPALGVTLSTIEAVRIVLDGVEVPLDSLLNQPPVVTPLVEVSLLEDGSFAGSVEATDADGDLLTFAVATGPAHGTLDLDPATGGYVYRPTADWSGMDSFEVSVTDSFGNVVTQEVRLTVEAVADEPTLSVVPPVIELPETTVLGNAGDNVLIGTAGPTFIDGGNGDDVIHETGPTLISTALDISASLTDLDGSETLSVIVGGMPPGAVLSAGVDNGDGSWTLAADELAGLELTAVVSGPFTLSIEARATEASNGSTATRATEVEVSFGAMGNEIVGGSGNDTIFGGAGDNIIFGGRKPGAVSLASTADPSLPLSGASSLATAKSKPPKSDDDLIFGGDGNDTIYGNAGDDELHGEAGDDWLSGGKGDDTLFGGDGNDELWGNSGDDVLDGGTGDDLLVGGSGDDTLTGGDGNDTVLGGSGDDYVIAGLGDDIYDGGSGFDTIDFSAAAGGMTIDVSKGTATGMGTDRFTSFERIIGSSHDDVIKGSSRAEHLIGGAGDDILRGMGGSDTLTGGEGDDTFVWLAKDIVSGGAHLGVDTVTDFGAGDVLDLSDILKKFKTNVADHVKLTDGVGGSMLSVDIGGTFYDVALLQGVHGTTAADLLASGAILA